MFDDTTTRPELPGQLDIFVQFEAGEAEAEAHRRAVEAEARERTRRAECRAVCAICNRPAVRCEQCFVPHDKRNGWHESMTAFWQARGPLTDPIHESEKYRPNWRV